MVLKEMEQTKLKPGWVRINVKSVGICGSDLYSITGKLPFTKYPITPGHEFSGIVTEINNTRKIKVGQAVTANPIFHCGLCSHCLEGNIHYCSQMEVLGVVNYNGAYAEEVVLPESMVEPLPKSLSYEQGAMIEPTAVAVEVVRKGNLKPGSKVAIFGAGNIGLILLQVVQAYGVKDILVIDPIKTRLQVAQGLGAQEVKTPEELEEQKSSYLDIFDLIIDGVACQQTLSSATDISTVGGKIVIYGVPQTDSVSISLISLFKKNVSLVPSRLYPRSFKSPIALLETGLINIDSVITHRIRMEDLPGLLPKIIADKEKTIKVIINM